MPTTHDRAAILSVGDELVIGQRLDTNSRWISDRLTGMGIRVVEHITVGDDADAHLGALRRLVPAVPLVISTGGLGPTADDLTRSVLASLLGEPLVEDADALRTITELFARRGREISPNQRLQAQRPPSAVMLENPNGTAPGLLAEHSGCTIACLPGPPNEMHPMFERAVAPRLRPPTGAVIRARVLHTLGAGEGDAAARLGRLMDRDRNPLVGTTASGGVVSVRIRYEGPENGADRAVTETESEVRAALDPFVFGIDDQTIETVVLNLLRDRAERLVTVESCTGGGLGALLTGVPGSSDAYAGGWVTYSNEFKHAEVGVPEALLRDHGAVSEPVARAMALGALATPIGASAHHALAITGIAGPGGGSAEKPVGTVFICRASRAGWAEPESEVRRYQISGDREAVRDRSAKMALALLRFHLAGIRAPRLLWELPRT